MISFSSYPSPEAVADEIATEDEGTIAQFFVAFVDQAFGTTDGIREVIDALPFNSTKEQRRKLKAVCRAFAEADLETDE